MLNSASDGLEFLLKDLAGCRGGKFTIDVYESGESRADGEIQRSLSGSEMANPVRGQL